MSKNTKDAFLTHISKSSDPISDQYAQILHEQLSRLLARLTPREEKILRMRFGINEDHEHTLEEIAMWFGLSKSAIHRIQTRALERLDTPSLKRVRFLELVESPSIDT